MIYYNSIFVSKYGLQNFTGFYIDYRRNCCERKSNANIGFEKQIWEAACVLWGHIPAAEYRKVIVGVIFLRYISGAFEKRYAQLVADSDGFEDDRDTYDEEKAAEKTPLSARRYGRCSTNSYDTMRTLDG